MHKYTSECTQEMVAKCTISSYYTYYKEAPRSEGVNQFCITTSSLTLSQIDTLAAEYPAMTNYLYCTYHGQVSGLC